MNKVAFLHIKSRAKKKKGKKIFYFNLQINNTFSEYS